MSHYKNVAGVILLDETDFTLRVHGFLDDLQQVCSKSTDLKAISMGFRLLEF
jgi:hypothetical protein